jgi:carboxymethylenebutenolidase
VAVRRRLPADRGRGVGRPLCSARMSAEPQQVAVALVGGAALHAELFVPSGGDGPFPGVLVLHESFGLNGDIRRIARRFADAGYVAIAPDLYSHGTRLICLTRVIVDMLRGAVSREIADILAVRDALAELPEVDPERTAIAGFCQGGGFALVAGTHPGFRAAAVNYGEVPRSSEPLQGVCPVVASYGARDMIFGRGMAQRLDRHLTALGVPHDVKTYDGAGHSFFSKLDGWQGWLARVPTPLAVAYDEAAAEDGWHRMLAFFEEHVLRSEPRAGDRG